jgi:hypothetical protein
MIIVVWPSRTDLTAFKILVNIPEKEAKHNYRNLSCPLIRNRHPADISLSYLGAALGQV